MAEIEELGRAIAEAKRHDPMAPVTVVVPSNYSGLSLRRRLARDAGGLINVQFLPMARLAELLGAPALAAAGRRPLTRAIRTEAIRAALADAPGDFAPVAGHAATVLALDRTFADLRAAPAAALDAIAGASARAGEVVRLFRVVRAGLADRYYDEHDLAAAAAASADVGTVVVYLPRDMPPSMRGLIDELGAVVIERDARRGLPVDRVIAAVDPDDEVRAAVRLVMEHIRRGTPAHRIALLWPDDVPYAVVARQQLDAAGIPHNGPAAATLAHSVTGGALIRLLALPDRRFRRDDVMAWLASAPVLEVKGAADRVPASSWDVVSGGAGVIEGVDQWHTRLSAFAAAQGERKAQLAAEDDAEPWRIARIDASIDDALRLRRFVAELFAALDVRAATTWSAHSAWAAGLLDRYLGDERRLDRWPEGEQEADRAVRHALDQLAALDDVRHGAVDLVAFRHAVQAELAAPAARHGSFGTGVFTAHYRVARGTDFDVVLLLGLVEGSLPGGRSEDALLPDRERALGGADVPRRGQRIEQELADFQAALGAAATERVLLLPCTDPRRRRELLPSRWLPRDQQPESVASFQHGITSGEPSSLTEYDLRGLLAWTEQGGAPIDHSLAADLPSFGAGLVAADFRTSNEFTRFDGNVGAGRVDPFDAGATHSPTSLEDYAQCPARYFYQRVLRLGPPEHPEEIRRISALDKGSLFHGVLDEFISGAIEDPSQRNGARLAELAEAAFDDYEARGLTGLPLLWRYERDLMRREFLRFLFEDNDGSEPLAAELLFGQAGEQPVVLTLPDGREVGFRGSADRVDRLADGSLRVTDYKTGAGGGYDGISADDPLARGRKLQLPLYGLAARARFGDDATAVDARYRFVSENRATPEVRVPVDDATLTRLREVLGVLVDGITSGRFPARPGDEDSFRGSWTNCAFCNYDRICAVDRDRAWERARVSSDLTAYVELAEGEKT